MVVKATARRAVLRHLLRPLDDASSLGQPIDDEVANLVVPQLLHLESADRRPDPLTSTRPAASPTPAYIYDTMQHICPR
jgi:hypothetical protein